ncbi:MAG: DUF503 domain-containing protein [Candidatus Ratteibacteria bacterium]
MFIGTLKIEIIIPGSNSLKDKRKIISSLQGKIKSKFNVSIAEIDYQDKWQRAVIGLCCVNSEKNEVEEILQKIRNIFFENGDVLVLNETNEVIYIGEK